MDQGLEPIFDDNSIRESRGAESEYSESATEYNTADLSDLSGLSKLLKADDSIADRVRCLLEDDNDAETNEKPALLSSGNFVNVNGDLREKMMTLFKDSDKTPGKESARQDDLPDHDETPVILEELPSPENNVFEVNFPDISIKDTRDDAEASPEQSHQDLHLSSPPEVMQETHRHMGDGADEDPSQAQRDSSDDIMNISDSTEYSDLPKVVDNPMMNSSTKVSPFVGPALTKISSNSSNSSSDPLSKITGQARYYADSDPNTPQFPDDQGKLIHLEKYVQQRIQDPLGNNIQGGNVPIHSTPAARRDMQVISPLPEVENSHEITEDETVDPTLSAHKINAEIPQIPIVDRRCSHESNITLRSRDSNQNSRLVSSPLHSASNSDINQKIVIPKNLDDEELLKKVKLTVSEGNQKSIKGVFSGLKGPHTTSEHSIASTVDSLAMQVKNLLQEESVQQHIIEGDLSDINVNEISHASNFSDEISNFEKTSLWKYTRQFLPGAMTPSREIRPLTKFSHSSASIPLMDLDSSSTSSVAAHRHPTVSMSAQLSSESRYEGFSRSANSPSFHSMHQVSAFEPELASTNDISLQSNKENSFECHKAYPIRNSKSQQSPSRIVGRYDRYSNDPSISATPHNESYKQLVPEYSQTPYTPYSFITPRKVAWETPNEFVNVKYKSPIPAHRNQIANDLASSRSDPIMPSASLQENSAYFTKKNTTGKMSPMIEKSKVLLERSNTSDLKRLTSDHNNSLKMYHTPTPAHDRTETPTRDVTSEDEIVVKPLTPPFKLKESGLLRLEKYKPVAQSRSINPTRSSKSVHFKEPQNRHSSGRMNAAKISEGPQYSLSTSEMSSYPASQSISPKVIKERPSLPKVLPTYDQLVAEREKHQEDDLESKVLPMYQKTETNVMDPEPAGKIESYDEENLQFSSLKPEICFDDSDQGESTHSETPSPSPKFDRKNYNLSLSDADLHRRTTLTDSGDSEAEKSHLTQSLNVTSGHFASSSRSAEMATLDGADNHDETLSPTTAPVEPAPLPYVRLGKKKPTMPLRHSTPPVRSISTEKVQILLMKERNVGRKPLSGRKTERPPAVTAPITTTGWSSSDEELMSLLETFSTKVPLMEKLLHKLYEKNLQKRADLEVVEPSSDENQEATVDRCVQTSHIVDLDPNTNILNDRTTNIPAKRKADRGKIYTEAFCQTSFVKSQTKLSETPFRKNEKYCSIAKDDVMKQPSTTENKENAGDQSKFQCAFFVDLTPEKLPKPTVEDQTNHSPVAWYEPYEYMPPWRRTDKADRPKLGFVNANIQDAFLNKKRSFVIRSWERQEDIAIRAEERKLKDLEMKIHDQIVALHREKSDTLPKLAYDTSLKTRKTKDKPDRNFGWKEMRMSSKQKYESLPEVIARKQEAERKIYYELNRKRALQYKRKISQLVLQKQKGRSASDAR